MEQSGSHTASGVYFGRPRHRLFMVVEDPSAALSWLEQEGYEGDRVWVLRGEEGVRWLDLSGRAEGVRGRVVRAVEHAMSADVEYLETLAEELSGGASVLAVDVPGPPEAEALAPGLQTRGARTFAYFSSWGFQPVQVPAR